MSRIVNHLSILFMVAVAVTGCASAGAGAGGGAAAAADAPAGDASAELDAFLAAGPRALVVFTTAWCEVCARESPAVVAWARAHRGAVRVAVVVSGSSPADARRLARERHLDDADVTLLIDDQGVLADRFHVDATPTLIRFAGATVEGSWQSIADVPGR